MSLKDVKVGDEVVISDQNFGTGRSLATAIGRKYITVGRWGRFSIETGAHKGNGGGNRRALTVAQWTRETAEDALQSELRQLVQRQQFEALSDDEIAALTEMARTLAKKLESK